MKLLKYFILGFAFIGKAMGEEYETAPLPKDIVGKTLEQLNRELFARQGESNEQRD